MIKDKLIIFYWKWIKRKCPHICKFCEQEFPSYGTRENCYDDFREEMTKRNLGYYEQPAYKIVWLIIKEKIRGDR